MKLLTIVIPCYNSMDYMAKAIESAVYGGDDVEVIIVNDGSTDHTQNIALDYQRRYPNIVKVIEQVNKGHGGAVNTGLENAKGLFFKVLDSDDWLDHKSLVKVLEVMWDLISSGQSFDMMIANYVYEKVGETKKKVINYRSAMPQDCIFGWNDVKQFRHGHYILMHSVIYRTKLLRECNLKLPEHIFYVDNIFVYQPLPHVQNMYYLDVNLYRYFIGRDDQSVTEENMIKRVDQQVYVNKFMIECCDVMSLKNNKLKKYMIKYLGIMMTISSVFLIKTGSSNRLRQRDELWEYLKQKDKKLYHAISSDVFVKPVKSQKKISIKVTNAGYKLAQKIYKFN